MDNALTRLFRALAVTLLALVGAAMALLFMASTAIAVGILYLVAKVRGKPFGVRAYWHQRQQGGRGPVGAGAPFPPVRPDVIDVEVREVR
ncbi:hypothetical protein CAL29_02270 [Bordetella genomosp. 10]|uniref:Uncharacterized protein n=1 Tax=Bordetella genomosp. 10 TaxID=1416804 RepID=A0A261SLU2_9BORD|nr:hypothetical protein [Bordetella genomosp. 10]OZI37273.1 hypothetical protein CAL29_02270 [Bordetella genomosp. 10]